MSGQVAAKHLRAALSRWPRDALRPEVQLQNVFMKRLSALESPSSPASEPFVKESLLQTNALLALRDDRFKNRYRVRGDLLKPASRPTYYEELAVELEEAPTRTFWVRMKNRLAGMFRLND